MTTCRIQHLRRPLDAAELTRSLVHPGGLWQEIAVVRRTGSTNADLMARARDGAPEGIVLAAEEQTAGRGRLGRSWVSPPRAALTFSLLVRPRQVPPARRSWLPLLAGVATAMAVREATGLHAALKWPNDVLAGERKLAGILAEQPGNAERAGDAVIVGIGVNVSMRREELPPAGRGSLAATSLLLEGSASLDREHLLRGVLAEFERWYLPWCAVAGEAGAGPVAGEAVDAAGEAAGEPEGRSLRQAYLSLCSTLGRDVRVELPGGRLLSGAAVDVDCEGRLVVRAGSAGSVAVAAGDVVHVR
jgi:BirA family biotin operon repressor/biotin-[acetyl-CoA-carboxylase] ligase